MKVSINDVARLAEVSIKTVSRVINNEPSVRATTRQKVMSAISELGYQPNQAARNLARSRSYTIGFVYSNPNAYYVVAMQEGIIDVCQKAGYEVMIHPLKLEDQEVKQYLVNLAARTRIAGLILTPPYSESPELLTHLDANGIDYIAIQSSVTTLNSKRSVVIDDYSAAHEITSHLIRQGHQKIGFLRGDADHLATQERERGYRDAIQQAGLTLAEQSIYDGRYSFESGSEGISRLLALDEAPTAIFACNDEIAAGALFRARLEGLRVPKDLAIAGFEDSPYAKQTWPPLTTANISIDEVARKASTALIDKLAKRSPTEMITIRPKLVIRGSSTDI